MKIERYQKPDMTFWKGRIDHEQNYDAFRWHQWIKPLDLSQTDISLTPSKVSVALLGFCSDEGVKRNLGRTGAYKGPLSIRNELRNLPCCFTQALIIYDAGNVTCNDGDLEKSQECLAEMVARLIRLGTFPILLGGGHEMAYGHYKGLNKSGIYPGIVNFDAHFDIRPYKEHGSSGTMFRQIYDDLSKRNLDYQYFAIGIQKRGNTVDLFKTAQNMGIQYLMASDIGEGDLTESLKTLDAYASKQEHLYLTICSDVFASAFAPGVSATQPLGLHPERILKYFKALFRTGKVVSFDIAEVSPRFDNDNITSNLAATFIFAAVNAIAKLNGLYL